MARLPLPSGVPVVADPHNVEFDVHRRTATSADRLVRRLYAARQRRATNQEEQRCAARADLVLATSDWDRELFQNELQIRNAAVIPNGIDPVEFQPVDAPAQSPRILFTGLMSYYANQHGVRWFLDRYFHWSSAACPMPGWSSLARRRRAGCWRGKGRASK